MRIAQSLTAVVPGQLLRSRFLEYQLRITTKLNWRSNIVAVITRVQIAIWKGKLRTEHCILLYCSYWPKFFSILAISQKLPEFLPTLLFNALRLGYKFHCAGLYIKRTNASFISHSWYTSNIESANKKPPIINVAFFSGITLVSDYGCKREDNKTTTMLYDRYFVYKTVKSSHLKKLQIIWNIKNLMFQVMVTWGVIIEPGGEF